MRDIKCPKCGHSLMREEETDFLTGEKTVTWRCYGCNDFAEEEGELMRRLGMKADET